MQALTSVRALPSVRARRGDWAITAIPAVNLVAWLLFPPDGPARQVVGEFVGSTMVLFFAAALLLATRARWLEPHFGGLDKMYRAHKRAALSGFLLLFVHFGLVPIDFDAVKPGTPAGMIAGYTVRSPADALFLDEIEEAARRHPGLRAHVVYSGREGTLTAEKIAAACGGDLAAADVYMCGPSGMTQALARHLRRLGVPAAAIHYEEFNFR